MNGGSSETCRCSNVLTFIFVLHRSQDSIGGVLSALWAGQSGVQFLADARGFCFLHTVLIGSDTHPALCSISTRDSFPRGKAVRCEVNHSLIYHQGQG